MTAYDIIKRPIITEQSMADAEMKRYTFEVAKTANKIEIAKAVEEIFGVKVAKVNTLISGVIATIATTPNASVTMLPPSATHAPCASGNRNAAVMGPEATPPESNAIAV